MQKRKFISVHFKCCNAFNRIYINKEGTAYVGKCPKCLRTVRASIGEGGTSSRCFEAN